MQIDQLATNLRDMLTVQRVYGEPFEKNGATFIPAATLAGGGGGGSGTDNEGAAGDGGGFGVSGRPVGAYVFSDGDVRWRPAVDVNRLASTIGSVVIVWLLLRRRRKARR